MSGEAAPAAEVRKTVVYISGPPGAGKSTVAVEVARILPGTAIVEVDAIKLARHGASTRCDPAIDFPIAGTRAADALCDASRVIVVEAFAEESHIEMVHRSIPGDSRRLEVILRCSLETARQRKVEKLTEAKMQSQFARFSPRYPQRRSVDTTRVTSFATAKLIAQWVREIEE